MSDQPNSLPEPCSARAGTYDYNYILKEFYLRAYGNLIGGAVAITDEIDRDYLRATKYKTFSEDPKYSVSTQTEFCAIAKYILIEATLKCYKLLFLTIKEDLLNYSNPLTIFLCTRNGNEYNEKFKRFVSLAEEADQVEITGRPIAAIDKIKISVRIGYELQSSIDISLARHTEKLKLKFLINFLIILVFVRIVYLIYPYFAKYANPVIDYVFSLEGTNGVIVSIIAALIVLIMSKVYSFIKKSF
jgi:hypothetical protein